MAEVRFYQATSRYRAPSLDLAHPRREQRAIKLSIAESINKKAASQHACPLYNISEDGVRRLRLGLAVRI
jgi:hypothetical protein